MADKVDELLSFAPYDISPEQQTAFRDALREELMYHYRNNEMFRRFCDRKGFNPGEAISDLEAIPPVAVSVYKELGGILNSVPSEEVSFALQSSATSGRPSTITVDKTTSRRQAKAMVKVVGDFIGNERKPFLIMDIDPKSSNRHLLGARYAAVTGYLKFANKVGYFLNTDSNGVSYFDVEAMKTFLANVAPEQPVVLFGFTYILFQHVLKAIEASSLDIKLPKGSKIIHIGGWKKLESEKISKELFNEKISCIFGLQPSDVIDIYGFTEQMGLNYPDCTCGFKHTSAYTSVIVRDPVTRCVLPPGHEGMLEFISPIPHSYPGNAVLTDDIGFIEPGECPFGRGGQRFKVVGRLKKAEVRGCGDILSSKLLFKKEDAAIAERPSLDVQYFKGELNHDADPEQQLTDIISLLRSRLDWLRRQPADGLIGLIGKAADIWLNSPDFDFLKDKGRLFLSQWCSASHLQKIAKLEFKGDIGFLDSFKPFPDSDRHYLKANSRGLVCHWMAGNVQILGMFALVQSIITKNVNLLKVAAKDGGVFRRMLRAFEGIEYTSESGITVKGDELLETIAVIYFPRHAKSLGEMISKNANVRIAWGGKEAVETVYNYPAMIDCETVIFGPKISFAVISGEMLQSEQEAKKLARKLSVDISVFDQTGCASPHNLFIERSGTISPERFCEILAEVFPKTEIQIPKPTVSTEQISEIHSIRGVYDFKGQSWGSPDMSWTILFDEENTLNKPVYSRVIFVHPVDDINDSLVHVEDYVQTIGIAAPTDKAISFASQATAKGAARCPNIGRMLNFESPWDGVFLFDRLVRWNTLFGPLA